MFSINCPVRLSVTLVRPVGWTNAINKIKSISTVTRLQQTIPTEHHQLRSTQEAREITAGSANDPLTSHPLPRFYSFPRIYAHCYSLRKREKKSPKWYPEAPNNHGDDGITKLPYESFRQEKKSTEPSINHSVEAISFPALYNPQPSESSLASSCSICIGWGMYCTAHVCRLVCGGAGTPMPNVGRYLPADCCLECLVVCGARSGKAVGEGNQRL